jgi:hypothetical protein
MIRGRIPVELPAPAAVKLAKLDVARMVSEDATRAATSRLSNLPRDADPQMRDQLARERDQHGARHRALASLGHRLNEWLMQLRPNTVLEMVQPADIKLRNGETFFDAIDATRNQISSLQGQLAVVKAAPLPVEDQRQSVAAYVEKMGQLARPAVSIVKDGAVRVGFRDVFVEPEQVLSLLAWLAPDLVRNALTSVLESQPRVVGAMPASERLQRVAELEDKLLELERQEEASIEHAAKQGLDILRRVDASPPVVLGVVITKKAQAPAQIGGLVA